MESNGLMGGIFKVCDWISKLAYVNLLWVIFTLIGFGLFGVAPSTVALFSIVRKWIMGENNIPVFSMFWSIYKSEFKKSNLLSFLLIFIIFFMYVDWVLIGSMQGILHHIFLTIFIIISIIFTVILVYIFPVYVHFEGSILNYFKSAILIGTSFPIRTLMMVLAVGTGILTSLLFPGVGVLFFGSGLSFALMYFSYSIFKNVNPNIK
ncbi:MAG TPA: DUF624 domain-containing protein [Metabacillus sp.]|nr:DUF624 domain-containing protein [Metabacillus sp.]